MHIVYLIGQRIYLRGERLPILFKSPYCPTRFGSFCSCCYPVDQNHTLAQGLADVARMGREDLYCPRCMINDQPSTVEVVEYLFDCAWCFFEECNELSKGVAAGSYSGYDTENGC